MSSSRKYLVLFWDLRFWRWYFVVLVMGNGTV